VKIRLFILIFVLLTIFALSYYPVQYYYHKKPDAHISMISQKQAFFEFEISLLALNSEKYNLADLNINDLNDDTSEMLKLILKVKSFSVLSSPDNNNLLEILRQDSTRQEASEVLQQRLRKGKPQFTIIIKALALFNKTFNNKAINVILYDDNLQTVFFNSTIHYTDNQKFKELHTETDTAIRKYRTLQKKSELSVKLLSAAAVIMALIILEMIWQLLKLTIIKKIKISLKKYKQKKRFEKIKKQQIKELSIQKSKKEKQAKINHAETFPSDRNIQTTIFNSGKNSDLPDETSNNKEIPLRETQAEEPDFFVNESTLDNYLDKISPTSDFPADEPTMTTKPDSLSETDQDVITPPEITEQAEEPLSLNELFTSEDSLIVKNTIEENIEPVTKKGASFARKAGDYIISADFGDEEQSASYKKEINGKTTDKRVISESQPEEQSEDLISDRIKVDKEDSENLTVYKEISAENNRETSGFNEEEESILNRMKLQIKLKNNDETDRKHPFQKTDAEESESDIADDDSDELGSQISKRIKLNHDNNESASKRKKTSAQISSEENSVNGSNDHLRESFLVRKTSFANKETEVSDTQTKFVNRESINSEVKPTVLSRNMSDDSTELLQRREADLQETIPQKTDRSYQLANDTDGVDDEIIADSQEASYWENVVRQNTLSSYSDYIRKYPKGKSIRKAKILMEEIFWKDALQADSLKLYGDYVRKFPNGKYLEEAEDKIEDILWDKYDKINSVNSYRDYCLQYPGGKHIPEATEAISEKIIGTWTGSAQKHFFTEEKTYCSDNKNFFPWQISYDRKIKLFAIVINMGHGYNVFMIENLTVIQMQLYNKTSGKRIKLNKQLKSSGFRAREV